jgi:hypothetical protein
MPAKAGIQGRVGRKRAVVDSRFRGNDKSESHEFFTEFQIRDICCRAYRSGMEASSTMTAGKPSGATEWASATASSRRPKRPTRTR